MNAACLVLQGDLTDRTLTVEAAVLAFKNTCKEAITEASTVLENDLGLGDYLQNLLKRLYNGVASLVTSNPHRFYTPVKSESIVEVQKAEKELDNQANASSQDNSSTTATAP